MSCACAVSRRWNLWTMINIQYSYTSVIGRAHAGGERRAIRIDCVPSSHLASEHFVNSFVPLQEGGGQRESQYYCYSRRRPRLHKRGRWNWEAINLGRLSRAHVWAANSFLSRAKEKLSIITKKEHLKIFYFHSSFELLCPLRCFSGEIFLDTFFFTSLPRRSCSARFWGQKMEKYVIWMSCRDSIT